MCVRVHARTHATTLTCKGSYAIDVTHSIHEFSTSFPPLEPPFSNTPSFQTRLPALMHSSLPPFLLPHLTCASAQQVMTGSIFLGGKPLFPGAALVISGAVLSPGQVHAVQCALAFAAVDKRLQGLACIHTCVCICIHACIHTYVYSYIRMIHTYVYVHRKFY